MNRLMGIFSKTLPKKGLEFTDERFRVRVRLARRAGIYYHIIVYQPLSYRRKEELCPINSFHFFQKIPLARK